jgi:hypothetical protein
VLLELTHVKPEAHIAQEEGGKQLPVIVAEVIADCAHYCQVKPCPERQKVRDVLGGAEFGWIFGGLQKNFFLFLLKQFSVDVAVSNVNYYQITFVTKIEIFSAAAR